MWSGADFERRQSRRPHPGIPWNKVNDVIAAKEHIFLMFGREAQRFAGLVRGKTQKMA